MADKHDKFQLLKAKYLEQIRNTERQLSEMKTKLQVIQELEEESENLNGSVVANGRYKDLGLTEAVLETIKTIGFSGGVSASGVAKHLLAEGFQPKGKNFQISVGTTLKRLAKKKISTELKDGKRLYRAF